MTTDSPTTLAHIANRAGIDVLDHLDQQVRVPVISGIQAQGDIIVIPADLVSEVATFADRSVEVHGAAIELLRSESGGNPHVLVSDVGHCQWNPQVRDSFRLALGLLDTDVTAYLIHPEHGATGIAPGRYVIRRQRDRSGRNGYVVD